MEIKSYLAAALFAGIYFAAAAQEPPPIIDGNQMADICLDGGEFGKFSCKFYISGFRQGVEMEAVMQKKFGEAVPSGKGDERAICRVLLEVSTRIPRASPSASARPGVPCRPSVLPMQLSERHGRQHSLGHEPHFRRLARGGDCPGLVEFQEAQIASCTPMPESQPPTWECAAPAGSVPAQFAAPRPAGFRGSPPE